MLVSVIVPCFNEAEVIEKTALKLSEVMGKIAEKNFCRYEIIFIDDGSSDDTLKKIKLMADKDSNIKYVAFSRNFGKEAGMIAGLSYAKGDCVIIMDADLQHPPELIPKMLEGWREGYDQVIAKRNRTAMIRKRQ